MKIKEILRLNKVMPLYFSGLIILYWILEKIFIGEGLLRSSIVLEIYFLSFIFSFTHGITYSKNLSAKSFYSKRIAIHSVVNLSVTAIFSVIFKWIPNYKITTILKALVIYVLAGLIIILGFFIVSYVEKYDLNNKLQKYKEKVSGTGGK